MEHSQLVLLADKELASPSIVDVGRYLEDRGLQGKTALQLYDDSTDIRAQGLECMVCGNYVESTDKIAEHRSNCSSKKKKEFHSYPCPNPACEESYKDLKELSGHQKRKHRIDDYTCNECNISFLSKKHLRAHAIVHELNHTIEEDDDHIKMLASEILKLKKTRPRVVLTSDDDTEDGFLSTLREENVESLVMVEKNKYNQLSADEKLEFASRFQDRGASDILLLPLGEEGVELVKDYISLDEDEDEEEYGNYEEH